MSIDDFKDGLGEYAKDIKLNLGNVLSGIVAPDLTDNQRYGVALASAFATRNRAVVEAVAIEGMVTLTSEEREAAKAAATIMGMNNVYYRFLHLMGDKQYGQMPARLRMNVIGNPGIAKLDFELYCLAVSAINGCGMCMEAHVHEVVKAGLTPLGVQSAIRIAAVINAAAQAHSIAQLEMVAA